MIEASDAFAALRDGTPSEEESIDSEDSPDSEDSEDSPDSDDSEDTPVESEPPQ